MKWAFLAGLKRVPEKPRIEPKLTLSHEPRSRRGPCRLVQALPAERRAVVTARCPRCGSSAELAREANGAGTCVLQGLDLDSPAAEQDEHGRLMPSLSFRTT